MAKGSAGMADEAWNEIVAVPEGSSAAPNAAMIALPSSPKSSSPTSRPIPLAPASIDSGTVFLDLPPVLIAEIFKHLEPRELSVVSCVCSLFRHLSSDSRGWKDFYCERWGIPAPNATKDASSALTAKTWRELYVAREARSKAFLGRFRSDMMHGHTAAIRCVRLLPPANLVFTAGYDSTLRIWDMEEGLPVTWSRPLGYTVRAIAVDMKMLVLGGSDAKVRIWRAVVDLFHIFDVSRVIPGASEMVLSGHNGPITSVGLDETRICSGSWDMTVRIWDRNSLKCVRIVMHRDWVWSLSLRVQRLVTTAGSDVYSWDVETGECIWVTTGAHVGRAYAVECSKSGRFVFTGGQDGKVRMYEDKSFCKKGSTLEAIEHPGVGSELAAHWEPHSGAVYALAFDDPWLVSASGDGSIAMMDVSRIMKKSGASGRPPVHIGAKYHFTSREMSAANAVPPQRMLVNSSQSFYSVDVGADRVVSAGGENIVRVWDFSLALEIEQRVRASRAVRLGQRLRRKQVAQHHRGKQVKDACNITAKREVIEGAPIWQGRGSKLKA